MRVSSLIFGALALVIASSISPVQAVAPCSRDVARPRKEFRNLSSTERDRYFAALRALKTEMRSTSSGSVSTYDLLVNIHITNASWVHGFANFFSWHRRYLREVERHMQRVMSDTTIMIPYWQWTLDSQVPEASPIFRSTNFGGNGGCLTSGPLANWRPRFPSTHCLSRRFDAGNSLSSWDGPELINAIIATSSTYNSIRDQIEGGSHASVHVNIGGDMSAMQSPNDPIFWSHHAFIDKIWDDWQKRNSWSNYWKYNGRNRDGTNAALTDVMRPWSHTVRQILWTENIGYCYQPYSSVASAQLVRRQTNKVPSFIKIMPVDEVLSGAAGDDAMDLLNQFIPVDSTDRLMGGASTPALQTTGISPTDRSNLFKLRYSKEIPEAYLIANNLNVSTVRQYEAIKRDWCDKINAVDTYISPCAIVNQPDALQYAAKTATVKKLFGIAKGDYMEVDVSTVNNNDNLAYEVYKQVAQTMKTKFGGHWKTTNYLQFLTTSH